MGLTLEIKNNKLPATLRLYNSICSYLFEQQYDEMEYFTEPQRKSLEKVSRDLRRVISKANGNK